uniref:uncharacterized protein si:ch211-152f22.4 isoform X2 n=1 Tax=Scatophagus argus TaxID=75038 RepID=UPI001ED7F9AF|nr:uncharacterized protein si:ch211-152f22.4 isoform X2 [Scatophagus argus]XP_046248462.1 uncharacterized protein si:ch211-152f22.4 isoform X2 [Scatophagus argus]
MAPGKGGQRRVGGQREAPGVSRHSPRRNQIRQGREGTLEMLTTKRRVLMMIVSTLQPLETTADPNFLKGVKLLNSALQIPAIPVIRSQLLSIYNEKEQELRSTLASVDDIVLTCELWSPRKQNSYLTVGCHFVDIHGGLKSYMLQTTCLFEDESADNIKTQLLAIMEAWNMKEKVHSVVGAGTPQLKNAETKWMYMPCFANTLHEVFEDLMNNNELLNVLKKCQNIVGFFKNDSEAERELREIQHRMNMEQGELTLYTGDRWLPSLHMLQQLIQQNKALMMVCAQRGKTDLILNENDKEKVMNLISALEPLSKATSMMKKEGFETISAMLPLLKQLMKNLEGERRKNKVAQTLFNKCKKKFGDIDNHPLALNTFLDPRFKNELGDENKKRAMDKIQKELSADPASPTATEPKVLHRYMAYPPNAKNSNPLAWWRLTGRKNFGELSKLALKKLAVVSTAVPLERAFSSAGDWFCNRRSFIEPENLNMILFLKTNCDNWTSSA